MNKDYIRAKQIAKSVGKSIEEIEAGKCTSYESFLSLLDDINAPKNKTIIKRLKRKNNANTQ